ncbi:MAG: GNAT family N-acetyltransferase [Desulfarculus sp.]|nr:GNAT family N-acetyltransferase [Desulfarculus sp.]
MPSPVSIRPATPADAADIAAILQDLGWFTHLNPMEPAQAREQVARQLALDLASGSHLVLVAQEPGGQVVAYGAVHWLPYLIKPGPEAYVSELFVAAAWRGQGVGGALLAAMEGEARARGCSQLMLINNQERDSYRRAFYAKQGWQERRAMANFCRPL